MSVQVQRGQVVQTTTSGTGANTIVPASGSAACYRDIAALVITTAAAAASTLTLSDGTKTVGIFDYPNAAAAPGAPFILDLNDVPLAQSVANAAWTITSSASQAYHVTAQYVEWQ